MLPPRSTIDKSLLSNVKIPCGNPSNDFPSDVLKHIRNNAIPEQTLKLMKVCKYFLYKKFPLNYVANIDGFSNFGQPTLEYYQKVGNNFVKFEVVSLNDIPNNLCIGGEMELRNHLNFVISLIPKIFACELKCLIFYYLTNIEYAHFKLLTLFGKVEKLALIESTIIYNNGEIVPYENLLDHVPVLQRLKLFVFIY
uniref:FBD domain-containing protein n=1 Tax=Panagrolaimus davidi TaxID=227884 RepID=A0A914PSB4_9BILA